MNVLKAIQKPIITVVLLSLLLFDHHHVRLVLAASGGRMGASSFSSRRSSRSSSTRAISSRSFSSGSYSTRISNPACSSSRSCITQTRIPGHPKSADLPRTYEFHLSLTSAIAIIIIVLSFLFYLFSADEDTTKTSVLKLQVGLLGKARSLQRDLNGIAETANTSTPEGFNYVLQEAILALLRHPDYCISGYFSVDVKRSIKEGEKLFNQLSVEERGKFDEETLVNVNNIRKQTATRIGSNGAYSQYIVVTIIVAASGVHEVPPITSSEQLKIALQKLASMPSSSIMAVEVLWTPQKENDSLTKLRYFQDYPLLQPI